MNVNDACREYFSLLEKKEIKRFLAKDVCNILADKYSIAVVFIYFLRAKLTKEEYNVRNFFLAIHLCHDIFEEIDDFKGIIIDYYLDNIVSKSFPLKTKNEAFHKLMKERMLLLISMSFMGNVSKESCDGVFSYFPHKVWDRKRNKRHGGIHFEIPICRKCMV